MISVIIPTFNEQEELPETLRHLARNSTEHEVIVVDAESSDGTSRIAQANGAKVINSPRKQRAAQMNLGAKAAKGGSFLFLHADTWLPEGSLGKIEAILNRPKYVGGGFARRFRSPSLFLRMTCCFAKARCRAFGWFLGDQGIFVRHDLFEKLNGFRDIDQFEDLDFCRRMKEYGRLATLTPPVLSSARRFREGPLLQTLKDLRLTARYFITAP